MNLIFCVHAALYTYVNIASTPDIIVNVTRVEEIEVTTGWKICKSAFVIIWYEVKLLDKLYSFNVNKEFNLIIVQHQLGKMVVTSTMFWSSQLSCDKV